MCCDLLRGAKSARDGALRRPMPPRFTLWHARNTRSLRILWTLEELGLKRGRDYALHNLRFPLREHHPEFLSANPLSAPVRCLNTRKY